MNKDEITKKIAAIEAEAAALRAKLEKTPPLPCPGGWWTINGLGKVVPACSNGIQWAAAGTEWPTRESAEREAKRGTRQRIIARWLEDMAPGWVPNWKDANQCKCFLRVNEMTGAYSMDFHTLVNSGLPYGPVEAVEKLRDMLNDGRVVLP